MAVGASRPLRVALVGLRCAGKSSVGRRLAELVGYPFRDLDDELASSEGEAPRPAGALLVELGEERFREREARVLASLLGRPGPLVLATGGGAVLAATNRRRLAADCACIWLRADPAVLGERLARDPTARPALLGEDAGAELVLLERQRRALYAEVADLTLDAEQASVDELARAIVARWFD